MKNNVLLENYLKSLRLPTFLKEHEKVARQSGEGNKNYTQFHLIGGPEDHANLF